MHATHPDEGERSPAQHQHVVMGFPRAASVPQQAHLRYEFPDRGYEDRIGGLQFGGNVTFFVRSAIEMAEQV
ncbi:MULTISPECIES: hypothetical protein [unclassified Mesorhizobium]|uniref:hypothetical protein n=1 Tax=unclassified Mesorhizobium TaxID=325217 RepID=UPI000FE3F467|nr:MULTISPECIES: hypothetical protein [unclassified Mesorhizobium]RWC24372.1 MAG: hypothetical protein EOS51_04070 [Mesorhizobium sp.]RWD77664.1 MAG: hypothetical protein EOS48_28365 [Mesorhizobium sp.]RWE52764.1 MAG: hypothetical protein EOS67_29285 [Mesorhizobium sp.]RWF01893.1 MAG: hypothetical protein EOS68_07110 [Mesorhizobium sp.]RWF53804.1 MAG: hypothetical protein EOS50_19995 [Mesorhizobium sp.]